MKKFVKPVAAPEQVPSMKAPPAPPKAAKPARPPAPAAKQANMARPPAAKTSRQVPSVKSNRGVVRTDTHNAQNQVPHKAKHRNRGF